MCTVKELIEELDKLPEGMIVNCTTGITSCHDIMDITNPDHFQVVASFI